MTYQIESFSYVFSLLSLEESLQSYSLLYVMLFHGY